MTQTQQTESAERIARPLIQLAKLNGISTSYIDQLGTYVEIRDEVLVSVLAALGVDASSDEAITASYAATQQRIADTLVEPTVVKFIGKEAVTPIRAKGNDVALKLTLEDGTEYAGDLTAYLTGSNADDGSLQLTLPDDIPAGYHTLAVDAGPLHAEAALICAPARIELPPAVAEKQRWGWMAQMYSIRSAESWGVGDYGDLKLLLADMQAEYEAGNWCVAGGDFNKDLLGDSAYYFGEADQAYSWAQPIPEGTFDNYDISLVAPLDESAPVPSCRNADSAYHEGQYVLTVDGFLVSKNVTVENAAVVDTGFQWSDHNPVIMTFTLR